MLVCPLLFFLCRAAIVTQRTAKTTLSSKEESVALEVQRAMVGGVCRAIEDWSLAASLVGIESNSAPKSSSPSSEAMQELVRITPTKR